VAQEPRRLVAVGHAELAARTVAIGVDGGLRHPELAGDLLGAEMLIDQPQALALTGGEELDRVFADGRTVRHGRSS
jgi:hypothetical protein